MPLVNPAVTSLSKAGSALLRNAVTLTGGTNVTLTQSGQDISIAATGGTSPLTTKGDIYTYTNADARLAVGTNGQILSADSGETTGLKWITSSASGATTALDNLASVAINTSLLLGSSDGGALGSTTKQWSDLFLAEGGVINWDNGDATITQTSNDITVAGITTFGLGTSTALTTGTIELGAASDTTLARASAGVVTIESVNIVTVSSTDTLTNKTLTAPIMTAPVLGTPASGTVTNLTGTASININGTVGATTPTTIVGTTITANTGLLPDADDGAYIGQAGTAFSDLFLAEGGVINWDSGDATITQTSNDITIAGISTFGVGTSTAVTLGTIELGAASDTTIARVSAGVISVESARVITSTGTTSGTILKNNGTTFVASTETYAAPGTSGNVLTSDGTNWTSAAAAGGGATILSIMPIPPMFSGTATIAQETMGTNTTGFFMMFSLPGAIVVNKLTIDATTVNTAGTYDIAVYAEDGQTKQIDITTASITTSGAKSTTVASVSLAAGIHYIAIVPNSTASVDWNMMDFGSFYGNTTLENIAGEPIYTGTATVTASTLPATFTPSSLSVNDRGLLFRLDT